MVKPCTKPLATTMIGIKDRNIFYAKTKLVNDKGGLLIITQNSYGYGDVIRLISYADYLTNKYNAEVKVRFVIEPDKTHLLDIDKTLSYYDYNTSYEKVIAPMKEYRGYYTKVLEFNYAKKVYEAFGCPKLKTKHNPKNENYICVWHPFDNLIPVSKDKMPISRNNFFDFFDSLPDVKYVTYRTDMDKCFETIRNASVCIGYEGLGQQIAYHYNKPLITFSNLFDVSKNTGGPNSYITNKLDNVKELIHDLRS